MTVILECEECGHRFEYELKPCETLICPKCKTEYDSIKVMNDEENKKELERFRSKYDRRTD